MSYCTNYVTKRGLYCHRPVPRKVIQILSVWSTTKISDGLIISLIHVSFIFPANRFNVSSSIIKQSLNAKITCSRRSELIQKSDDAEPLVMIHSSRLDTV